MNSERVAWFDCYSGISGDMCLAALIDLGVPFSSLKKAIATLGIKAYSISTRNVLRNGIRARRIRVTINEQEPPRRFGDIKRIIEGSSLPDPVKKDSLRIFRALFRAEGRVHGKSLKEVHLHELGATDCLIDITGTLYCLHHLGIKRVFSTPLNLGKGMVRSSHGPLPVPAPATLELLRGVPFYSNGPEMELTTPTGAAIISHIGEVMEDIPPMVTEKTGYGAGGKDIPSWPNILRVTIGTLMQKDFGRKSKRLLQIETNIDDMNPQAYEYIMSRLFQAGALDVYLTNVIMKKGRPGVVLNVLSEKETADALTTILFRETTTLGIRIKEVDRICLPREVITKETPYGTVRFKVSEKGLTPEYEDCKEIAKSTGKPLIQIMRELNSLS
ncbi:MAG: nickel pincer cofactor biosynthesis protein LarC [Nitrospirae bacterium]|nr:MAG: nickel pincer cofactor biosynthesis protein LarC [Nitrospirota bacterium]